MGLILDSSILIAGERRGETVTEVIQRVAPSTVTAARALGHDHIELTHGIYRAKTDADRVRRRSFH